MGWLVRSNRLVKWLGLCGALSGLVPLAATAQTNGETPPSSESEAAPDFESEARAWFQRGSEAYEAGEFERALHAFEKAFAAATPARRIYILYNLGVCHDQLGHVGEALEHYRQYLRLVPEGPRHRWVRGRVRVLSRQAGEPEAHASGTPALSASDLPSSRDASRSDPLRTSRSPREEGRTARGGAWWPWAVAGGVLLAGGVVAAVLLAGGSGDDGTGDYTFGTVEALR